MSPTDREHICPNEGRISVLEKSAGENRSLIDKIFAIIDDWRKVLFGDGKSRGLSQEVGDAKDFMRNLERFFWLCIGSCITGLAAYLVKVM